jgi:hypothetical protein
MNTECNQKEFEFQGLKSQRVVSKFDGGVITSDGGSLLLRELENKKQVLRKFSRCFADHRKPDAIEHTVQELLSQRVMGICLGYEDLNDHDSLRIDPLLALASGKIDIAGAKRRCKKDKGKALAGRNTLNRLELTPEDADEHSRYKKIVYNNEQIANTFIDVFIESHKQAPKKIILDLDTTDDRIHGTQEGHFFHGYYGHYCYLPLYIFCGDELLCAKLNTADKGGGKDAAIEVKRIVSRIREQWPAVSIVLRGDADFAKDDLMTWAEKNRVDYVFGLRRNNRLETMLAPSMDQAKALFEINGCASRVFAEFIYQTLKNTWHKPRRVIGKAEYLSKGRNPRFIVTSLTEKNMQTLYEDTYCARGNMENRIKEQQLDLFSDRTSTHNLRSNQLRLYFASMAYVMMNAIRKAARGVGDWGKAQCHRIRNQILKIGAQITISCRRIKISFSEAYPYQKLFAQLYQKLHE